MTSAEPVPATRRSGSGRPALTKLVQQIADIVAQGEDSGSQSQASDGGLRLRLRTVLLSLLDGIMSDTAGERRRPAAAPRRSSSGGGSSTLRAPAIPCLPRPTWAC